MKYFSLCFIFGLCFPLLSATGLYDSDFNGSYRIRVSCPPEGASQFCRYYSKFSTENSPVFLVAFSNFSDTSFLIYDAQNSKILYKFLFSQFGQSPSEIYAKSSDNKNNQMILEFHTKASTGELTTLGWIRDLFFPHDIKIEGSQMSKEAYLKKAPPPTFPISSKTLIGDYDGILDSSSHQLPYFLRIRQNEFNKNYYIATAFPKVSNTPFPIIPFNEGMLHSEGVFSLVGNFDVKKLTTNTQEQTQFIFRIGQTKEGDTTLVGGATFSNREGFFKISFTKRR